ncbi:insulinase family protein [Alteromonas sp. 5E99-2]|uniref:M16 family metallopeptidase n=1 Tax=Alteromonas sp. 5E99-2 TaxID=2817683 RepID=UPI001A99B50B|nr:pitrilysin family protein [Alteromonas sp. 5E99-2]MBO1256315.1 insulinase family protein [Alteromonas sp. 5E99-2]
MTINKYLISLLCIGIFAACSSPESVDSSGTSNSNLKNSELVPYQEFQLENGLNVLFHIDHSDPVVAVALTSHVGSAREKVGRTGFAHLFEHLLFLESENLGKGGLDKLSAKIGGSGANGSTNRDRTNYFQTVPNDALEKMIWAEADKLGYFINTVTDSVLAKEKQVVKNEKRQSYDNRPYGHLSYVVGKALYPEEHPYNWQVIGSLEDLQNATLADVKEFFNQWYVPNNVTLTIAGDFNPEQAKIWVEKYFNEIPKGPAITPLEKQPAALSSIKNLYYEDNFATLPLLQITWPAAPLYSEDSYALKILAELMSNGKKSPLDISLIQQDKVAPFVQTYHFGSELSGEFTIITQAFNGTDLDAVKESIDNGFSLIELNGFNQEALDRIKTAQEVEFYDGITSVLGKAFKLAQYNIFANDAAYIDTDLKRIQSVTLEDVERVYETYIKDKPYVIASFVPKGNPDLALKGAELAHVVEEKVIQGAEDSINPSIIATYTPTPSSFDRSVEPPYGQSPVIPTPQIWSHDFANGMKVMGIEDKELPLVRFELAIEGGHLLDTLDKSGVASLLARLMNKGTASKSVVEFEQALEALGTTIVVITANERITIEVSTLAKNFDASVALLEEMMLEPRWDEAEFALIKADVLNQINGQQANPNAIANNVYGYVKYGQNHILSTPTLGTKNGVEQSTIDDLKRFYQKNILPNIASLNVVGSVNKNDVVKSFSHLAKKWQAHDIQLPSVIDVNTPTQSAVYFYDVPGAKQSIFRIGNPALLSTSNDYYPATVMNYILGGGSFASRLTQELREGKGYTYGIFSRFNGSKRTGDFLISSAVRSNVTLEAASLVKDIMGNYGTTFSQQDLNVTQGFMIKSKARSFETLNAKLTMLENISLFDYPVNYAQLENEYIKQVDVDAIRTLAEQYIHPDKMFYVIVGDAETQLERLEALGFGKPILMNEKINVGNR